MFTRLKEMLTIRSVRYKLMVASIACILVPAACTMLIYNSLTQAAVKKQAISNASDSLLLLNGNITNLLKRMLSVANYVQLNPEMNAYFKMLASGNAPEGQNDFYRQFTDKNRVIEQLDSLSLMALGEHYFVTVLLTDGSYFMNYSISEYNPLELKSEKWFESLKGLNGYNSFWTDTTPTVFRTLKMDSPYQVSVVRTLRLDNKELYGYVVVTMLEKQLNQLFDRLNEQVEYMIVNSEDQIISDVNPKKIGTKLPYLQQFKEGATSAIMPINGENFLITKQDVNLGPTGWKLVSLQPYQQAILDISTIFNNVFLLQIGSFFVFLILLLLLLRTFTQPLMQLGKTAKMVQLGNLSVRSGIRGQDEIGRLGYSFDQMLDKVKDMIAEVSDTQARKRKAELAMLQAQISPHFLFNVLNSIRMKVMRRGDPESATMIGSLSKLLRMSISHEQDEISLHEETDLVSHYVDLMNMRQKEETAYVIDIPSEAFLIQVPRFFLQPLVENALIHGLNRGAGLITIRAQMEKDHLVLTVEDNGAGMDADKLGTLRRKIARGETVKASVDRVGGGFSGIGLLNVVERMKMTFGDQFQMDVQSELGQGTSIRMIIPKREESPYV
ncbi:cache domain-containing sensor histidine kinase [Paenibacillus whitsoniae]|uniref:histidine kinase n=1 Tax=Paenibacillus whitsoniae TaxID=2496558 RepID=A0A430J4H7_9BACL|nr:sensor histidine kinase [Paenibacillus whitsoniae]RTE02009.1 sensor histidine kinase [Paenibacillus whitsoniae]